MKSPTAHRLSVLSGRQGCHTSWYMHDRSNQCGHRGLVCAGHALTTQIELSQDKASVYLGYYVRYVNNTMSHVGILHIAIRIHIRLAAINLSHEMLLDNVLSRPRDVCPNQNVCCKAFALVQRVKGHMVLELHAALHSKQRAEIMLPCPSLHISDMRQRAESEQLELHVQLRPSSPKLFGKEGSDHKRSVSSSTHESAIKRLLLDV
eukprot:3093830-Amphidinium_carterae.1